MPLEHCELHQSCWSGATAASPHPGSLEMLRIIQGVQSSYLRTFSASSPNSNGLTGINPVKLSVQRNTCLTEQEISLRAIPGRTGERSGYQALTALHLIDLKDSFSAEGSQGISLTR